MTTISIDFSEHLADGYARNNRRVDVTGTPDEPFAPRAKQELGVDALHFIVVGEYGSVVAAVGDHATFGEVADFAGGLALPLDDARRGGPSSMTCGLLSTTASPCTQSTACIGTAPEKSNA
ncbi:hypothetical protein [Microbacterium sp. KNMS]